MAKHKLKRFAEVANFPNVFQVNYHHLKEPFPLKGKWGNDYFQNNHPIVLELGCGKGEYTLGLAENDKDKNFIGMDIKGARLWRGSKTALEKNMKNVCFLRTKIDYLESFFDIDEVSEIWITFPDPQPQEKREKKRLTSPVFINRYKKVLKKDGIIHLKTDNLQLYQYTIEVIKENNYRLLFATDDLYKNSPSPITGEGIVENAIDKALFQAPLSIGGGALLSIQTFYEKKFLEKGMKINYLNFQLEKERIVVEDINHGQTN